MYLLTALIWWQLTTTRQCVLLCAPRALYVPVLSDCMVSWSEYVRRQVVIVVVVEQWGLHLDCMPHLDEFVQLVTPARWSSATRTAIVAWCFGTDELRIIKINQASRKKKSICASDVTPMWWGNIFIITCMCI